MDQLIGLLSKWSTFALSKEHDAALLEVGFRKERPKTEATDDVEKPEENDEDELPQIGILNSFFVEDIEAAIATVKDGRAPTALRQYLTPLAPSARVDLYSPQGRKHIATTLHPSRMNAGRWFANPEHAMSLMQQFAINTALSDLTDDGLFSVNGPPGTGKTTLLRDVIADNIVRRATVLAVLATPSDALRRKQGKKFRYLIPELTGFEMVVASSNNAAVENISKDLPQSSSVWTDDVQYLRPVAHKLAAQQFGGACRELSSGDRPWGMIAAAMGKKANRSTFVDRVFFNKIDEDAPQTWSGDEPPLNIWQWRSAARGDESQIPNFRDAQRAFVAAQNKVEDVLSEMQAFQDLRNIIGKHDAESWCMQAQLAVSESQNTLEKAKLELAAAKAEKTELEDDITELVQEVDLIGKTSPVWWKRLFSTGEARAHRRRMSQNAEAQIQRRRALKKIRKSISKDLGAGLVQAETAVHTAQEKLQSDREAWTQKQRGFGAFKEHFGDISYPENLEDLELDKFQIDGIWHTDELAELRSNLFREALQLHEAWLFSVSQNGGGFGGNLVAMQSVLQNTFDGDAGDRLALWQSLFMVVPVISSTFASMARQFEGIGTESIGWLFVDEAGQAVPQAAVGALLRSKRALVIGDPLQIEPVFTLPKQLISELSKLSSSTSAGEYSPDRVSAQVLADRANPFGAMTDTGGDNSIWIGSPLCVHRRCIDPMFRMANKIAYEDRMVFGLEHRVKEQDRNPFLGPSCWVDQPGTVAGRQSVPGQIQFTAGIIASYYDKFDRLPEIYVISPFKEVKEKLAGQLIIPTFWTRAGLHEPPRKLLRNWISERVGTVRTFQGKEEDSVIMVLGADKRTEGAARWAASKPNILNVALTRAKRRFYLVGDRQLWGKLRYFQDAHRNLPAMSPTDFKERADKEWEQQRKRNL